MKGKRMDKVNLHLQMDRYTKVTLKWMKFVEKEYINGVIEKNMKDFGKTTKCMVEVYWYGQMENNMKENFKMTKDMAWELSNGLMVVNMKEVGWEVNSMELVFTQIKPGRVEKENGMKEKESAG